MSVWGFLFIMAGWTVANYARERREREEAELREEECDE